MYLLDADWIIQAFGNRQPAVRTLEHLAGGPTFVSYVTIGEVYERAFASANPQAHLLSVRQFLSAYRILTLTDPILERFAEVRAHLRRRVELIPDFDLLVGATDLVYDLTFNVRHFGHIPALKIYQPN